MTTATWVSAPLPPEADAIARPDWPGWLAPVLARRGITSTEQAAAFLEPSLEQLHNPLELPDMEAALERLVGIGDDRAQTHDAGRRARDLGAQDLGGVDLDVDVSSPRKLGQTGELAREVGAFG